MSTPTFNAPGAWDLSPLVFENGGMGGLLAETGNTAKVPSSALQVRAHESQVPGAAWTLRRVVGIQPRTVVWDVQLKAVDEASLNAVLAAIDTYAFDGRPCQLSDGHGRETLYAVLDPQGTQQTGPRLTTSQGEKIERFSLGFRVLWPATGVDQL